MRHEHDGLNGKRDDSHDEGLRNYFRERVDPLAAEKQKNAYPSGVSSSGKIIAIVASCIFLIIASALVFMESGTSGQVVAKEWNVPPEIERFFTPPVVDLYNPKETDPQIPRAPVGGGATLDIWQTGDSEALTLAELYKKCSQWVVAITANADDVGYYWGTGIIFAQDGYIVTNSHILEGANSVSVILADDSKYEARLIGSDAPSDIAVLKINAENLPQAVFGDSSKLEVGEEVAAIGNPLGEQFRGTITNGIISAINRDLDSGGYKMTLLQTNAAINEGNSGGPLLNMYGQVVGITNMKIVSYYSSIEGIGFAIPTATIKAVVDELVEKGFVSGGPMIGISGGEPPKNYMRRDNFPSGVYVADVDVNADVFKKGVRRGDVIIAVQGIPVSTTAQVNSIKENYSVGDELTLTVCRKYRTFDVAVVLCDAASLEK